MKRTAADVIVDPIVVRRSRDLLERGDNLLANADGVADSAERFRQYYLAALRGAGSILAVLEPSAPTARRRGSRSAWARLSVAVPEWDAAAGYLASVSDVRMKIESGQVRTVDTALAATLRRYVVALLDDADAIVVAYEQGKLANGGRPELHLVS
ncbi:SAV_6107 family HEPN domain-containing protein [Gordonia sp. CPCC 205333]|uniref:SAV_6107 family HEPN domain-containing protein n=1 Tax=Gordonia sp. CPCC 205333 TaxID=3140790 RepID=UPI003AF35775